MLHFHVLWIPPIKLLIPRLEIKICIMDYFVALSFILSWWNWLYVSLVYAIISTCYSSISLKYLNRMDEGRQPLSRKLPIASSKISPYRLIIILRLVVLGFFFHYRVLHPVHDAFGLWLTSVICEIWFAVSWIFDQFPKWYPIERETYLDRLSLRYISFINSNLKFSNFSSFEQWWAR